MTASADDPTRAPHSPTNAGVPTPPADRRTRTDRRAGADRRQRSVPVPVERRTGDRRAHAERRDGKTAGGYDLDADTLEFIHAVNRFKADTGRLFPTWSEIMEIVRGLGYEKRPR